MTDAERLRELEIKFAFLEKQAEAQDRALYEQDRRIGALEKAIRALGERVRQGPDGDAPANEKPPHY